MAGACRAITLVLLVFLLTSCLGYKTPTPESKEEILKMDPATTWIRGRGLSDADIPSLSRMQNADFVDFCGGWAVEPQKVTDNGLETLANLGLPVRVFHTGFNNHITDKGLESISKMRLDTVILECCQGITDAGISSLMMPDTVRIIRVEGCPGITDESLRYMAQSRSLMEIRLGVACESPNYTIHSEKINGIDLSKENQITLEGLKMLVANKRLPETSLMDYWELYLTTNRAELLSPAAIEELRKAVAGTKCKFYIADCADLHDRHGNSLLMYRLITDQQ